MGYESKLYVVEKSDYVFNDGMKYASVLICASFIL